MTNTGAWDTVRYAIDAERRRQDKLWGVQDHDHFTWLAILTEEVGETAQAILKALDPAENDPRPLSERLACITEELTQTAAVAVAWLENIERRKQQLG